SPTRAQANWRAGHFSIMRTAGRAAPGVARVQHFGMRHLVPPGRGHTAARDSRDAGEGKRARRGDGAGACRRGVGGLAGERVADGKPDTAAGVTAADRDPRSAATTEGWSSGVSRVSDARRRRAASVRRDTARPDGGPAVRPYGV